MQKVMETSPNGNPTPSPTQWTLFSEAPPAKTSPWLDCARAWMESEADCSTKWLAFASAFDRASSSGRTCQAPLAVTEAEISRLSSMLSRALRLKCRLTAGATRDSAGPHFLRAGGMWLGGCSMRNTSVWPNDASVCSLSAVLETQVASKYFLSPRACAGILRRAEKRGKELPEQLARALRAVAASEPTLKSGGGLVENSPSPSPIQPPGRQRDVHPGNHSANRRSLERGGALMDQGEQPTTQKASLSTVRQTSFGGGYIQDDSASTLKSRDYKNPTDLVIAHTLRGEGFDASEDGTGRQTPIVMQPIPILEVSGGTSSRGDGPNGCGIGSEGDPMFTLQSGHQHVVAFDTTQITSKANYSNPKEGGPCHPLAGQAHAPAICFQPRYYTRDNKTGGAPDVISPPVCAAEQRSRGDAVTAIAFTERTRKDGRTFEAQEDLAYALTNPGGGGRTHSRQVADQFGVRRLTPMECERLQGFPDGTTEGFSDSCRYRMLGNSVAIPVVSWIAKRIRNVLNRT